MLQLASETLPKHAADRLVYLQGEVNKQAGFAERAKRAESLWNGKTGSQVGKAAFEAITQKLISMCVSLEICNYCEQNEANDIEHIYPKSLFPALAFIWDNYLLACKQCNTAYKLDSFALLDGNEDIAPIPRGTEPAHANGAFINPRTENPADFMLLNLGSYKFELMPGIDKKAANKARNTLEILQLNERDQLVQSRKTAAIYRYQRMELLVRILNANSIAEIDAMLTPFDGLLDNTLALSELKLQLKDSFKLDIQLHAHPSVWYAIQKIGSVTSPKWAAIFAAIPEALNW
jgi:uncharacterized protein (TIGR02646 family)